MNNQNTSTTPECCGDTCGEAETRRTIRPVYQLTEAETGVTLDIALPGVRKEDLSVSATESILTLSAARADSVPEDWKVHRDADRPEAYELRVRLNRTLDPGRIDAVLQNGVLRLTITKREEAQPRRISVN